MAPPDFGRSVNPISTKGGRLYPPNNTGNPGFSDLPTALNWKVFIEIQIKNSIQKQRGLKVSLPMPITFKVMNNRNRNASLDMILTLIQFGASHPKAASTTKAPKKKTPCTPCIGCNEFSIQMFWMVVLFYAFILILQSLRISNIL